IAEALSRGYDFRIGELLGESWQRVKGIKGIVIGGFVIYYAALFAVSFVLGMLLGLFGLLNEADPLGMAVGQLIISMLAAALTYPFLAGLNMVGIRRAADQPVS